MRVLFNNFCLIVLITLLQLSNAQLNYPGCADLVPTDFERQVISNKTLDPEMIEPLRMDIDANGNIYLALKKSTEIWKYAAGSNQKINLGKVPASAFGFHGLLGFTLSPDFEQTGRIFVLATHRANVGDPIIFRVSRYRIVNDGLDLSSEKTVLQWNTQLTEGHTGGDLQFDSQGILYITTGNDSWADPTQIPPAERPAYTRNAGWGTYRTPIDERIFQFNALRSSANTNDLRGKILRLTPINFSNSHLKDDWGIGKTYNIPSGNLYPVGTPKTKPEIFAMGLRNPYTVQIDKYGNVYVANVGPQGNEDNFTGPSGSDQLYVTKSPANFGHPMFVDERPYQIYDFTQEKSIGVFDPVNPINYSVFNTGLDTLPPLKLPAAVEHFDQSLNTNGWFTAGGMSLMSGPIYEYDGTNTSANKFPPHFDGKWIIAEYIQSYLKVATVENEKVIHMDDLFKDLSIYNPTHLTFGPDGVLYMIEYGPTWNGSVDNTGLSKIVYKGKCHPVSVKKRVSFKMPSILEKRMLSPNQTLNISSDVIGIEIYNLQGRSFGRIDNLLEEPGIQIPATFREGIFFIRYIGKNKIGGN